jgi:hypothetical protein
MQMLSIHTNQMDPFAMAEALAAKQSKSKVPKKPKKRIEADTKDEGEASVPGTVQSDTPSSGGITESLSLKSSGRSASFKSTNHPFSMIQNDGGEPTMEFIEEKGQEVLQGIREAMNTRSEQERELSVAIEIHMDRAKARYQSVNSTGAVLSMRKIKRLQTEKKGVSEAIEYLGLHEVQLLKHINKATTVSSLNESSSSNGNGADALASLYSSMALELSQFNGYATEVEKLISSNSDTEATLKDEELLAELTCITEDAC